MNKAEKPDINDPKFWEHVGQSDTWLNESKYKKALKEWESNQQQNLSYE